MTFLWFYHGFSWVFNGFSTLFCDFLPRRVSVGPVPPGSGRNPMTHPLDPPWIHARKSFWVGPRPKKTAFRNPIVSPIYWYKWLINVDHLNTCSCWSDHLNFINTSSCFSVNKIHWIWVKIKQEPHIITRMLWNLRQLRQPHFNQCNFGTWTSTLSEYIWEFTIFDDCWCEHQG